MIKTKSVMSCIFLIAILTFFVKTAGVFAAQVGDFTFTFLTHISGKSKFTIDSNYAYCESLANTYYYHGDYDYDIYLERGELHWKKCNYKFTIVESKWFGKKYDDEFHLAEGVWQVDEFNNIRKGKYTVNVDTEDEMASYGAQISGKGIIYDHQYQ